jgi:hypothetical protein
MRLALLTAEFKKGRDKPYPIQKMKEGRNEMLQLAETDNSESPSRLHFSSDSTASIRRRAAKPTTENPTIQTTKINNTTLIMI